MRVRIATTDTTRILFANMRKKASDLRDVARTHFNPDLDRFFAQQFDSKGAEGGHPWAPLSPNTLRARVSRETSGRARFLSRRGRARGGLFAVLWDTGRARASLIKVGPESILVMQPLRYERGSTVPYLRHHSTGYTVKRWGKTKFSPRRVPARQIVPERLPPVMIARWEMAIGNHITGV